MIKGYIGDFGSGKTLNMVYDLMRAMKRGRRVISNTPIKFYEKNIFGKVRKYEAEFIPNGDDFQKALLYRENCIMAIDEAAVYLPNNYWNKMPAGFIVKFAQQRKYRTDFVYTCQVYGHSVKRLRDLTHDVMLCYARRLLPISRIRFRLFGHTFGIEPNVLFIAKRFNPAFFNGAPSQKKYERYHRGDRILYPSQVRQVIASYDTNYVVDMSAMLKVRGFNQPSKSTDEEVDATNAVLDTVAPERIQDRQEIEEAVSGQDVTSNEPL